MKYNANMKPEDVIKILDESKCQLEYLEKVLKTYAVQRQNSDGWNDVMNEYLVEFYKPWKKLFKDTEEARGGLLVASNVPRMLTDRFEDVARKISKIDTKDLQEEVATRLKLLQELHNHWSEWYEENQYYFPPHSEPFAKKKKSGR